MKKTLVRRPAPVHAMIEHPIFLRKTILSAAIDATKLLKEIEEYRIFKVQKAKAHRQLTRSMRELRTGQKMLEHEHLPPLPEMHHSEPKKTEPAQPMMAEPRTALQPRPVQKSKSSELDRLTSELRDIEERLKRV